MRYQVKIVERTIKYIIVEAMSLEEADVAGLARAASLDPDPRSGGPTEVYSIQISDDEAKVT